MENTRRSFIKRAASALGATLLVSPNSHASVNESSKPFADKRYSKEDRILISWLSTFTSDFYYTGSSAFSLQEGQPAIGRQVIAKIEDFEKFTAAVVSHRPETFGRVTANGNQYRIEMPRGAFDIEFVQSPDFEERLASIDALKQGPEPVLAALYNPVKNKHYARA